MTDRSHLHGIALACAAGFFWGSMGVAAQYLLQRASFEVLDLVLIRLLGAGGLLLFYEAFAARRLRPALIFEKRNALDIFIYGLGLLVSQITFFLSIEKANAATASLMVTTVPLFVTGWTAWSERRAVTKREWLSIAMAAAGVACIVTKGRLDAVDFSAAGVFWGIVSAGFVAFGTIQPKRVLTKIPVGVVVGSGMLSGGLVLFIISPPDLAAMHWTVFTAAVYFYIAAFGTVAAFCCYLRSLAFIPAPVASLLACIEPLSAVILGVVLMGLTLNAVEIVGIVIIFTMAVMLARAPKAQRPAKRTD